ncbi:MAG TPA: CotH kinase family protein, partial [Methylomirabilota bacterium]|nr:CotH kinase family protein [Methylomirabilota bacterium]
VGIQRHSDDQLRIAARPSLGASHLPAMLLRPALEPAPRTLIIDPQKIGWVDQLVYDLVRTAGGVAPRSRVVRTLLNGQPAAAEPTWTPGIARLFERVDDRFLLARWGHANFDLIKGSPFQVRLGSAASFDRLAAALERPGWRLADVERHVDIDALIVLNFALTFLASQTTDGFQGYLAFDRTRDPPLLWTIAWDADHSFRDLELDMLAKWGPHLERGAYGYDSRFLPVWVVLRQLEHDADFRARYLRHAERMLNHVFTLEQWHARRGDLGWAEQPDAVALIERFLRERPTRVRQSLSAQLGVSSPHRVRVAMLGPGRLVIDGVERDGAYEGHYFPGGVLEVSVPDALRWAFRGLTVNGQAVPALPYRRAVDGTLEVQARFAE